MTKTARRATAGAAAVVAVLGWTSGAAAMESGDGLPTVVVRIDHEAGVPASELQFAEGRTAEVFRRTGIRVTWVDGETAMREEIYPPYTILVLATRRHEDRGQQQPGDDKLGLAAPLVHRAYVYYDRIVAMHVGTQRSIGSILGDVIAHELGHLLLPLPGHSFTGIMRPNVSANMSIETFDGAQARHILARLRQAP